MPIPEPAVIILLAFLVDLFIGDPEYRSHPIRIIGRGIELFLKVLRRVGFSGKLGGVFLVLITTVSSLAVYLGVRFILHHFYPPLALGFDLFICYSCLALKDLTKHMKPIINALESGNLSEARKAVAMVVGRDVSSLDEVGVVRAAVETLAENFVDGFLSPLFWYVVCAVAAYCAGLPTVPVALCFMIIFKVASTLDSMVGYKNEEFSAIGWAGARLDDLMNYIPARFSLINLFAGAALIGLDAFGGLKVGLRDRLKHDSPNAAHAESFVAGALHIRLGGPTRYREGLKDKAWLGDEGGANPEPEHIRKTTILLNRSAMVAVIVAVVVLVILI